jgi:hypothetical protein
VALTSRNITGTTATVFSTDTTLKYVLFFINHNQTHRVSVFLANSIVSIRHENKVLSVQIMKAFTRSRGMAPLILSLGIRWSGRTSGPGRFTSGDNLSTDTIGGRMGPRAGWTFRRTEGSHDLLLVTVSAHVTRL